MHYTWDEVRSRYYRWQKLRETWPAQEITWQQVEEAQEQFNMALADMEAQEN